MGINDVHANHGSLSESEAREVTFDGLRAFYVERMAARDNHLPMTLGNMRRNGVHAVIGTCRACGRAADVVVDQLGDGVFVPDAGWRMVCSACGGRKIETRPAWHTMWRTGMGR